MSMLPALTCRRACALLSAEFESTLPPGERAALQSHLRQCPHCTTLRDQLHLLHETALQGRAPRPNATVQ
jgi:hypothetical protein